MPRTAEDAMWQDECDPAFNDACRDAEAAERHIHRLADAAAIWKDAVEALHKLRARTVVHGGYSADIEDLHPLDLQSVDLVSTFQINRDAIYQANRDERG